LIKIPPSRADEPVVRTATAADVPAIFSVRTAVTENLLTRPQLAQLGITEESVTNMLGTTHGGWCVDGNEELAGFAMADHRDGTVFALFVRPGYERRGIGSGLLAEAVAWLSAQGYDRVTLTTDAGTRAFQFYEAMGWRHTGRNEHGEIFEFGCLRNSGERGGQKPG
jgi:GNAT superfamily N-acetyltransferase